MFNHAPSDYICPICAGLKGDSQNSLISSSDFIYRDNDISAIINSFFITGNEGHVIIFPNNHFENIYDVLEELLGKMHSLSKKIAVAIKEEYKSDGITILQNNEPASEQHAFHYHLHIFPRYDGDNFHANLLNKQKTTSEERKHYAEKLKKYFES
jgi:histidine triad (HIT) family protein